MTWLMKVIGSTVFVFPHPPPSIVIPRSTLGLLTCTGIRQIDVVSPEAVKECFLEGEGFWRGWISVGRTSTEKRES